MLKIKWRRIESKDQRKGRFLFVEKVTGASRLVS